MLNSHQIANIYPPPSTFISPKLMSVFCPDFKINRSNEEMTDFSARVVAAELLAYLVDKLNTLFEKSFLGDCFEEDGTEDGKFHLHLYI